MEALFFLIPLALIFCVLTVKAFFWAVNNRQFENLDSAAQSILFDDDRLFDEDRSIDSNSSARNRTVGANSSTSPGEKIRS